MHMPEAAVSISFWSQFIATLLGAAFGVVAGALVQYLAEAYLNRRKAMQQRRDISAEAVYNISAVGELIAESGRLRAAAQPGAIQTYFGVFQFNAVLWIAMQQMVTSGLLYRAFTHMEIEKIQKAMLFLNGNTGQFVANRINQIKAATDINDALQFANWIEATCKQHLDTIIMLRDKHTK
jgi:hypothetical protein